MKICHPISEQQLRKISAVKAQLGLLVELAGNTGNSVNTLTFDVNDFIVVLASMESKLAKVIRQVESEPFLP